MVRKNLSADLFRGVETGFPKRSCSIKMLEQESIQAEAILLSAF